MDPSYLLLGVVLLMLLLMFRKSSRQRHEYAQLVESIQPGARIMTSSGLHATITAVGDDDTVELDAGGGNVSTWDRRAIMRILEEPPSAATSLEPVDSASATLTATAETHEAAAAVIGEADEPGSQTSDNTGSVARESDSTAKPVTREDSADA